jgi:hypothetical protein
MSAKHHIQHTKNRSITRNIRVGSKTSYLFNILCSWDLFLHVIAKNEAISTPDDQQHANMLLNKNISPLICIAYRLLRSSH